ncbi:MAG: hypothetical protein K8I82_31195 [Anaerolineae bacterium]|nr:hypothetical protein [Anaerolineae bacterium]
MSFSPMDIISVTSDLSIEYGLDLWRLVHIQNLEIPARPLLIANRAGLVFDPAFAAHAEMASTTVRVDTIAWIILDWEAGRSRWRLGLMLYDPQHRPSDAHALVIWPAAAEYRYAEDAWKAADALAVLLGVPLRVNASEQVAEVAQIVEGAAVNHMALAPETAPPVFAEPVFSPPVPEQKIKLYPLPLEMGRWILRDSGEGLRWEATRGWLMAHSLRTLFFVAAFVVFILLGIGSRTSGLAPVTPEWLPYMAFGIGLVLAYSAAENFWSMLTPSHIVLDDLKQEVRSQRALTGIVSWRLPYSSIQYILVSQEKAHPQGRRSSNDPMLISQDTWVHFCASDKFYLVGEVEGVTGKSWRWEEIRQRPPEGNRYPLNLDDYDTALHHAVQHMAVKLSVPAYVDLR